MAHMLVRIIMPCGGSSRDVIDTLNSINDVSQRFPDLGFKVYKVFNNGLTSRIEDQSNSWHFNMFDIDINPVASAALARNAALDFISSNHKVSPINSNDYVIFLDAGDLLLPDMIDRVVTRGLKDYDLIIGSAIIKTENKSFERLRVPIFLRYVMNPIYLGSSIARTALALSERFEDGRKEDWKFWLAILDKNPKFTHLRAKNFIYTIKNRSDHSIRKGKLIKHQFRFYRQHLNFNYFLSCFMLLSHYITLVVVWWIIMPIREKISFEHQSKVKS